MAMAMAIMLRSLYWFAFEARHEQPEHQLNGQQNE
ncbi:hypothetical protein COLO4_36950 [Corchorus olitorius]|uniref:Uncharacterized protein n=1 Tax=Corchorus olitorius TaxID=93759 RepID=A0A1R3G428_9ROSI|nr:hypothetical protein COLO4_36950 [Corchorus olitorius]